MSKLTLIKKLLLKLIDKIDSGNYNLRDDLKQVEACLYGVNSGLTYSNFKNRSSVIVIGLTSSAAQF